MHEPRATLQVAEAFRRPELRNSGTSGTPEVAASRKVERRFPRNLYLLLNPFDFLHEPGAGVSPIPFHGRLGKVQHLPSLFIR